jgi:hypothetical protein
MMIRLTALAALLASFALPNLALARSQSGYTVSRTSNGIQLILYFDRREFPAHALIAVTATLRNLSHRHLAVERGTLSARSLCSRPLIRMVSVNAKGQNVEAMPPIPVPMPDCPHPGADDLPIGHSVVEHQLIELWSSRLISEAEVYNHVKNCYNGCNGYSFQGPIVRFRLHRAPAPTISVQTAGGSTSAAISLPPGVRGPLYFRSWGRCSSTYFWTPLRGRVVPAGCSHPRQWHLDVAALSSPVASLNLGG